MWILEKERCNKLLRAMGGFIAMNCIRDEGGDIGETESKEGLEVLVAISDFTISILLWFVPPYPFSPTHEDEALKP